MTSRFDQLFDRFKIMILQAQTDDLISKQEYADLYQSFEIEMTALESEHPREDSLMTCEDLTEKGEHV